MLFLKRKHSLRMRLGDLALTVGAITLAVASLACETGSEAGIEGAAGEAAREVPAPQFTLTADQTHNRFSRTIEPILRVQSGAVIEAFTEEASDQQLTPESTVEDLAAVEFDPIHPLTGPVYVEGAEAGDLLAVTLHEIEIGDWGWTAPARSPTGSAVPQVQVVAARAVAACRATPDVEAPVRSRLA